MTRFADQTAKVRTSLRAYLTHILRTGSISDLLRKCRQPTGLFESAWSAHTGRPQAWVGIMGKHPAWQDYIPWRSFDGVPPLQHTYDRWIDDALGRTSVKARWQQVEQEGSLLKWQHWLLLRHGDAKNSPKGQGTDSADMLLARIWPSCDGRQDPPRLYPMAACVQIRTRDVQTLLKAGTPTLQTLEQRCRETTNPSEVIAALSAARESCSSLPDAVGTGDGSDHDGLTEIAASEPFATHPELLLHALAPLECVTAGRWHTHHAAVGEAAEARLQITSLDTPVALVRWTTAIDQIAGPRAPFVLAAPDSGTWVDLFIGPPSPNQIANLLLPLSQVPLSSEQPVTTSPDGSPRIQRLLAKR